MLSDGIYVSFSCDQINRALRNGISVTWCYRRVNRVKVEHGLTLVALVDGWRRIWYHIGDVGCLVGDNGEDRCDENAS